MNLHKCTKVAKYQDFQYRLLLSKITLNAGLTNWGILDDKSRTFCESEEETIQHLFGNFSKVQPFIEHLYQLCELSETDFSMSLQDLLFNAVDKDPRHILQYVIAFMKQHIYRCRCQKEKLHLPKFAIELAYIECIENTIAKADCMFNRCKK